MEDKVLILTRKDLMKSSENKFISNITFNDFGDDINKIHQIETHDLVIFIDEDNYRKIIKNREDDLSSYDSTMLHNLINNIYNKTYHGK